MDCGKRGKMMGRTKVSCAVFEPARSVTGPWGPYPQPVHHGLMTHVHTTPPRAPTAGSPKTPNPRSPVRFLNRVSVTVSTAVSFCCCCCYATPAAATVVAFNRCCCPLPPPPPPPPPPLPCKMLDRAQVHSSCHNTLFLKSSCSVDTSPAAATAGCTWHTVFAT